MDNFENEQGIQQPTPTPEAAPSAGVQRNYFRAAPDLCGTEAPGTVTPTPGSAYYTQPQPGAAPRTAYAPMTYYPNPTPWNQPMMPSSAPVMPAGANPVPASAAKPVVPPAAAAPAADKAATPPASSEPASSEKTVEPRRGGWWKTLIASILVVALIAGGCVVTAAMMNQRWEDKYQQMSALYNQQMVNLQSQIDEKSKPNEASGESVSGSPSAVGEGLTPGQVYAMNVDAVVAVQVTLRNGYSMGSGFIMTTDGYVTTNYHVVEGAAEIEVVTHDGTTYPAELVGYDDTNDVAVLKMDGSDLPCVKIGSSDDLIVGDQVAAIGNPLGELTNTLTVGFISAKERDVTTSGVTINMIQTDAAINSGNSGGPLFNMKGEVVGITTAKYSGESSSGATIEGIGFAIPIDDVYDLIDDLITQGYVKSAYLGVLVSEINAEAAAYYGWPQGAYVQEVTPGYCAEAAGIQAEDIIVALGTYKVKGLNDLTRVLRNMEPGETTTVTVYRGGEEIVLEITLDEKPLNAEVPAGSGEMPEDGSYEEWYEYFKPFFGDGNG